MFMESWILWVSCKANMNPFFARDQSIYDSMNIQKLKLFLKKLHTISQDDPEVSAVWSESLLWAWPWSSIFLHYYSYSKYLFQEVHCHPLHHHCQGQHLVTHRNLCHRHQGHPNQNEAGFIAGVNMDSVETICHRHQGHPSQNEADFIAGVNTYSVETVGRCHQGHPNQNEAGFIADVNTDSVESIWATSDVWVIVVEHRIHIQ